MLQMLFSHLSTKTGDWRLTRHTPFSFFFFSSASIHEFTLFLDLKLILETEFLDLSGIFRVSVYSWPPLTATLCPSTSNDNWNYSSFSPTLNISCAFLCLRNSYKGGFPAFLFFQAYDAMSIVIYSGSHFFFYLIQLLVSLFDGQSLRHP